jgi:hypothetical protein
VVVFLVPGLLVVLDTLCWLDAHGDEFLSFLGWNGCQVHTLHTMKENCVERL